MSHYDDEYAHISALVSNVAAHRATLHIRSHVKGATTLLYEGEHNPQIVDLLPEENQATFTVEDGHSLTILARVSPGGLVAAGVYLVSTAMFESRGVLLLPVATSQLLLTEVDGDLPQDQSLERAINAAISRLDQMEAQAL